MSDHTTALVPIATGQISSPELHEKSVAVDVGLFAEALVYYDRLLVQPGSPGQFGAFVRWFAQRGLLQELIALIRDDTVRIYDYAFLVNPMIDKGVFSLWNITDPVLNEPNSFARRLIDNGELVKEFPDHETFDEFKRALDGRVIEVKSDGFGPTVEGAVADFLTPERNALLTQVLLDELFALKGLGKAPTVRVTVERAGRGKTNGLFRIPCG